jgi:hypothetical protein
MVVAIKASTAAMHTSLPVWVTSSLPLKDAHVCFDQLRTLRPCRQQWTHVRQKSHLVTALVQAGALLINHIAPGNRTVAPSA